VGGSQQQQPPAPKKKRTTAPKEYVPAVGSANYAFVITLYLVRIASFKPQTPNFESEV
jgi:hypothetical protein